MMINWELLIQRELYGREDETGPREHGLDWAIAPMTRMEYFSTYYERKPFVIHRDQPAYYHDVFSMENISALIDSFPQQRRHGDWVIVKRNFITSDSYKELPKAYEAYLQGYTLSLFIINRLWAPLGGMVDDLDYDFGFPWRVNMYLTPKNSQGFRAHTDQHDFFIMQIDGKKKWRVYSNPIPLSTRKQELGKLGEPIDEATLGTPIINTTLYPGDTLYVPRGFIHIAETYPDEGSAHLTTRMTNSFFFNYGKVFLHGLPKPPKQMGLPSDLGTLQELDLEFRKSTPVKFMQQTKPSLTLAESVCNASVTNSKQECIISERWVAALERAAAKDSPRQRKGKANTKGATQAKAKAGDGKKRRRRKRKRQPLRPWLQTSFDLEKAAGALVKLRAHQ